MAGEDEDSFAMDVERHVKFWKMHLSMLPRPYVSGDDQRYVVQGLTHALA